MVSPLQDSPERPIQKGIEETKSQGQPANREKVRQDSRPVKRLGCYVTKRVFMPAFNYNKYRTDRSNLRDDCKILAKVIHCADGLSFSAQANSTADCTPKDDAGPWTAVEVSFPSRRVEEFMEYAEDSTNPTETVYGWVPVEAVEVVVEKHGGLMQSQPVSDRKEFHMAAGKSLVDYLADGSSSHFSGDASKARRFIIEGRVKVNGEVITDPAFRLPFESGFMLDVDTKPDIPTLVRYDSPDQIFN